MLGMKGPTDPGKGAKIREVRGWVRERLSLSDDVTVMVTELTCSEPGCPPIETVVAVMRDGGKTTQAKVPRRLAEVTRDDVNAMQFPGLGEVSAPGGAS